MVTEKNCINNSHYA